MPPPLRTLYLFVVIPSFTVHYARAGVRMLRNLVLSWRSEF
jgi:hypothetical protein